MVKETLIHIDETYDCHMVTPLPLDPSFRQISHALAANLSLKGIMDVEAISGPRGLKVIEIDARFPSQTPTVVYLLPGIILIRLLFRAFTDGDLSGEIKLFLKTNIAFTSTSCFEKTGPLFLWRAGTFHGQ